MVFYFEEMTAKIIKVFFDVYNEIGWGYREKYIDKKIIIELKIGDRLIQRDFNQVNEYLKILDLRLGLLILITKDRVIPRRVVNDPS